MTFVMRSLNDGDENDEEADGDDDEEDDGHRGSGVVGRTK